MEMHEDEQQRTRPLAGPLALIGLGVAAAAALYWVQPLAQKRGESAASAATSALSLTYLRIELRKSPDNAMLRLQLAQKLADIGEREEAREVLQPLLHDEGAFGRRARVAAVQLAFAELIAHDRDAAARLQAKQAFARTVEAAFVRADVDVLTQVADLSAQADAPELRARALAKRVRLTLSALGSDQDAVRQLGPRLKVADAGYLAVARPYESARLYQAAAEAIGGRDAVAARDYAALAIQRTREGGDVRKAYMLTHRFAKQFINDEQLSALELQLAGELGPELALETALDRSRRQPEDRARRREVVKWALFSNRPELALDELVRICFVGCTAEEAAQLRALSDGRGGVKDVVKSLEAEVARSGLTEERLTALVAAYEVQGKPQKALHWIQQARMHDPEDASLLRLELTLEKRMGRQRAARRLLVELEKRDALNALERDQMVDDLLAQGRLRDALRVITRGSTSGGPRRLRDLLELALEADDMTAARQLAVRLVDHPESDPEDHDRYASLLYEFGEWETAGQALFAAWERFGDLSLLDRAMSIYVADGSPQQLLEALERARVHSPDAVDRYLPTRLRIEARHRLASYAAERKDYRVAMAQLTLAQQDLVTLWRRGELGEADRDLLLANRRSALSLALQQDDPASLAKVYPQIAAELSVRERVYVLRRLGREDEAFVEALSELQTNQGISDQDRQALAWDVEALATKRRRALYVGGRMVELADVRSIGARTAVGLGFEDVQVLVSADVQRLSPQGALADSVEAQTAVTPQVTLNFPDAPLAPQMRAGFDLRDGMPARPMLSLSGRLEEPGKASLVGEVAVNETATDTAAMRLLGTRHTVRLGMTAALGESWFVSASGAGHAYYSRTDNAHLGTGITADVGLGMRGRVPGLGADWNARLTGRSLPRFERQQEDAVPGLFPDSTHFVGVGVGLARGQLGEAQLWGRDVNYELDAAAGVLWPMGGVGFAASAAVGMPIATGDQLMVRAQVDNTIANNAGQTALSVLMNYSVNLNR